MNRRFALVWMMALAIGMHAQTKPIIARHGVLIDKSGNITGNLPPLTFGPPGTINFASNDSSKLIAWCDTGEDGRATQCRLVDGATLEQLMQSILDEMRRQNDAHVAEEDRLMKGWNDALKLATKINAALCRCAGVPVKTAKAKP